MKLIALLIGALLTTPALVRDMGYCPDVGSGSCAVRPYWPQAAGNPTGVEVYWLENNHRQVCFVTRQQYIRANIGFEFDCIWRERTASR